MYRYGICKVEVGRTFICICGGFVIEADFYYFYLFVNLFYYAYIAVKNSLACLTVILEPADVVVVLNMHYLVARAEGL